MSNWRTLEACVVAVVVLALVTSGVGGGVAGHSPPSLGDGTATLTVDSLPTDRLHVDEGRFGTDVRYLRVPDVTLRVDAVSGTPRLVYRVDVPALDVSQTTTKLLTGTAPRTLTVRGTDRALAPGTVTDDRYTATVSIRVQSFTGDRTVLSTNETVEVRR